MATNTDPRRSLQRFFRQSQKGNSRKFAPCIAPVLTGQDRRDSRPPLGWGDLFVVVLDRYALGRIRVGPAHWLCCNHETYVPADPTSAVWYSNERAGAGRSDAYRASLVA
jgi:hypothetical protein